MPEATDEEVSMADRPARLKSGAAVPVANWSHVEGGKITRIRVTFDPRPFLG
jgi:hypothetical protein